jgi:zinc protease
MITAGVVVRGGSAAETAKEAGLAALTYDLLDEGAGSFNNLQLANEFAKLGSRVQTYSRREYGAVQVELLKKNADAGMDLLSTIVRKPTFAQADFDRVRAQRMAIVKQREGQPRLIAQSVFDELAYGGDHPYGHDEDGTSASLEKLTKARVQKFWTDVAEPKNAALILAGDITLDEAKALGEKHFGKWIGAGHAEKTPADPKVRSALKIAIVDVPGAPQSIVRVGRAVMAHQDPDEAALVVFDEIMGGQFSSRLNLKLREEKQWTYGAKSKVELRLGKGPWMLASDVQSPNTADAVNEILAQFDLVKSKGVTDDEVARAKDGYIKSLPGVLGLPQQQIGAAATLFTYNLPSDYWDKRVEAVKAVKADDVKKMADRVLVKEDMVVVVVGDKASVEPKLKSVAGSELASFNRDGSEVAQK